DDARVRWRRLASTEDCANARNELARRERLREVVVRAELEADHSIGFLVARGQDEDRHVAEVAQPSTELEAVDVGQPEVEHDEAGPTTVDCFEALRPRAFTNDLEAGLLEIRTDERADRFVVFDHDGDTSHGRVARIAVASLPTWSRATTSPSRRRRRRTRRPLSVMRVAWLILNITRLPSSSRIAMRGGRTRTTMPRSVAATAAAARCAETRARQSSTSQSRRMAGILCDARQRDMWSV